MMTFFILFLVCIPAMVANATPVLARKIPLLNFPISEYYLGAHKTRRGLLSGIVMSAIITYLLGYVDFTYASMVDFFYSFPLDTNDSFLLLGIILGSGALIGDSVKSFFKRKIGIVSGASWYPWDQVDYILGMILATLPFHNWTVLELIFCCGLGGMSSYAAHYAAYVMKMINTKH